MPVGAESLQTRGGVLDNVIYCSYFHLINVNDSECVASLSINSPKDANLLMCKLKIGF